MGYFSELSIRLQELQAEMLDTGSWEDRSLQTSYPTPVQQLLWRLEDFKEHLRNLIEDKRDWETAYYGAPRSDWEKQYRQWPDYLPEGAARRYLLLPDAFYVNPSALSPRERPGIEETMKAIAATQYKLLCHGYDADAEEERLAALEANRPLEGQLELPLAA